MEKLLLPIREKCRKAKEKFVEYMIGPDFLSGSIVIFLDRGKEAWYNEIRLRRS